MDKRRKIEVDWTKGVVHIHEEAQAEKALGYFLRGLLTAIHYRSGLDDESTEESFTHSLATGLVEIARANPLFWEAFIQVAESTLKPNSGWVEAAGGLHAHILQEWPKRITYKNRGCRIQRLPLGTTAAYGFYTLTRGLIEVSDDLHGTNLAIVVLHEVLHFLHECEAFDDATNWRAFIQGQVKILMRFWKDNPTFWRWWLNLVNPHSSQANHPELRVA